MDKLQLRETIIKHVERPVIPGTVYPVTAFGAVPDSLEIQTEALQTAIDFAAAHGGGRVSVPAGRYRTGALRLKSRVELHLESRETVLAFVSEDMETHYPVVFCHWEAAPCYNFSPLLYAFEAEDIAVTGEGILDGGADADHWWNWHHQVEEAWSSDKKDLQNEDRMALRRMNLEGVPVTERIFGPGHYLRPNFVQPIRCKRVLFQGFTLKNSPMWQLNPVMCESITVDGVTLSSHGANNDGCDPESCRGVHITGCRFDTGDDCISLKSGRDRDGREANMPCEFVLIEHNEFADGHGGVALGSEMSGGIRCVLAWMNHFSSPDLTYALRLKTNAKRGGKIEDVILADSVMDHVHGAAVHGTMLYEDGRNGDDLPVFRNLTIENIRAYGGDYGIFLEAFEEVPITGLVLRNIEITGADRPMRSMNWQDPVVEQVTINGLAFPRPGKVRVLGIPFAGEPAAASCQVLGGSGRCQFVWEVSEDGTAWRQLSQTGSSALVPETAAWIRVTAIAGDGQQETSRDYRVMPRNCLRPQTEEEQVRLRLAVRGMAGPEEVLGEEPVTRQKLAGMMFPLMEKKDCGTSSCGRNGGDALNALEAAVKGRFLSSAPDGGLCPDGTVTRQEMATVAMQSCGVNYRNASSTMPVCGDVAQVGQNYGTNVARALYFGFMTLEEGDNFCPGRLVSVKEAAGILDRVADFAGI